MTGATAVLQPRTSGTKATIAELPLMRGVLGALILMEAAGRLVYPLAVRI
jgi:hypothetical protein